MSNPFKMHKVIHKVADCDFCKEESGIERPAVTDAPTIFGPWADMCESHTSAYMRTGAEGLGYALDRTPEQLTLDIQ